MSDRIPMTKVGYDKLKTEVDQLELEEMPEITKRIAAARSEGDLSETLNTMEHEKARECSKRRSMRELFSSATSSVRL